MPTDHELGHSRDITWRLQAKQAQGHISESWVGMSWIMDDRYAHQKWQDV